MRRVDSFIFYLSLTNFLESFYKKIWEEVVVKKKSQWRKEKEYEAMSKCGPIP